MYERPAACAARDQVSLAEVIAEYQLEHGLAELVAYLSLAAEDRLSMINDERSQTVSWTDDVGIVRQATLPEVIFLRHALTS